MAIRYDDPKLLHGEFQPLVADMYKALAAGHKAGRTKTRFEIFETLRLSDRQAELVKKGVSKAGPWHSRHQFGLAVDFVPCNEDKWSWELFHDWEFLHSTAAECGLVVPIKWDLAHIEHPNAAKAMSAFLKALG